MIYFKKHLLILIGRNQNNLPESATKSFQNYVNVNKIKNMNIYTIRSILRYLRLSKYNRLAPKLLARFGNCEIPTYTDTEIEQICKMFNRIEYHLFTNTDGIDRKNSPFYTFLAYRIIGHRI